MFELNVVSNTPMTGTDDINVIAETFLVQIGYLPSGNDSRSSGANGIRDSVPYRLFMDYFMKHPSRGWTADELAALLDTTKPTIYRHINKLKSMDLLESVDTEVNGQMRKGFRIRYGDLALAWNFVESNVKMAMDNYRKTVTRFQELAKDQMGER